MSLELENVTPLIRSAAEIVTKTLETASPEMAASLNDALNSGAAMGVKLDVLPTPRVAVVLTQPDGSEQVLIDFPLEMRDAH